MTSKPLKKVWADGCYDLVHFGHANSLRQAKELGDYLIVGVHSDEEVSKHKCQPIYTQEERIRILRNIKWVDEVVHNQPYLTTIETLKEYNCDFCCHGNDISISNDGVDTYHIIKNAGKYKEIERTQGISTTNLLRRILSSNETSPTLETSSPWTGSELFLNMRILSKFISVDPPQKDATIIYCPGTFDFFHDGHVSFLENVKSSYPQSYIIIGLYSDKVIGLKKSQKYPIMSVQERLLNVLSCRLVADVIINAPYIVTEELIQHFCVDVVAYGNIAHLKSNYDACDGRFDIPKRLNRFLLVKSTSDVTTESIIKRIITNKEMLQIRNQKKEANECSLYKQMLSQ